MARQLIICCDGTNNNLTGRRNDTNVTQLCELLSPEAQDQLLYYDPGVGNPGELPGATFGDKIGRHAERLYGLVFGKGIYENIGEAYRFLMRNWRPGDQVFLFGFSRGAFTARSVGGLVTQFGILRPDMDVMVPTLLHIYFSDREKGKGEYELIRAQIREAFASESARLAPVWFVGVWDTVASVGAPFLSREITASPTIVGKNFKHVRQALALDEYRHSFRPRPYVIEKDHDYAAHGQSIGQQWFSGAHCDIGGGYANAEAGLSRQPLLWMLEEAAGCELRFRPDLAGDNGHLDTGKVGAFLDQRSRDTGPRRKLVHSETWSAPLWALGGQSVRDPQAQPRMRGMVVEPPEESPSVAGNALRFPADTVWSQSRLLKPLTQGPRGKALDSHPAVVLLLAVLAGFLCWVLAGAMLLGPNAIPGKTLWTQLVTMFVQLPKIAHANFSFAGWQLSWFTDLPLPGFLVSRFAYTDRALLFDLGFIASYGYILGFAASWAFAKIAGLRRVGMPPRKDLAVLGMAPCVAVVADVAENFITWLLLLLVPSGYFPPLEGGLAALMTCAALLKWAGWMGCAMLLVLGVMASLRRSAEH
jgi:hypothetical protein